LSLWLNLAASPASAEGPVAPRSIRRGSRTANAPEALTDEQAANRDEIKCKDLKGNEISVRAWIFCCAAKKSLEPAEAAKSFLLALAAPANKSLFSTTSTREVLAGRLFAVSPGYLNKR